MHRVRLLRHHGITPYIVFDGGPLPAKQGTEESRATKRAENLARGKALAAQGQHARARECFCKCVDVTPQMAFQFIKVSSIRSVPTLFLIIKKALRAENVPYVVAPYEADAQMAYLEANGVVSAILTEDSDLLVFGCRTVLLKLDATSASVTSISHADFGTILPGWTHSRFRAMAILSGCDYLASLSGVGLKTARAWLSAHETVEKALAAARLSGKIRVPSGYLENFNRAQAVFLHQRVFDSTTQQLVNLTPPAPGTEFDAETDAYIGRFVPLSHMWTVFENSRHSDLLTLNWLLGLLWEMRVPSLYSQWLTSIRASCRGPLACRKP
jgi:exonuclease-1